MTDFVYIDLAQKPDILYFVASALTVTGLFWDNADQIFEMYDKCHWKKTCAQISPCL